jgi:hypothetical protein
LLNMDFKKDDFSYEELLVNKEIILNSSHWQILNKTIKLKVMVD